MTALDGSATAAASRSRLEALLARHRAARAGLLERDIPFSWWRFVSSLASYALLVSDAFRSGFGVHDTSLPRSMPNEVVFFGPFANAVSHTQRNNSTSTHDIWAYKFDTTSVSMRAYAELFRLHKSTWPPCLLYLERCDSETLGAPTVFQMLDSLVDAAAARRNGTSGRTHTLRVTHQWVDRLHHLILPQIFGEPMVRATQALYYDTQKLSDPSFQYCSGDNVRPHACEQFTTNFAPICKPTNAYCQGIGHIWKHALMRKRALHEQYVNTSLDILVLESQTDRSKGAFSFQGRQFLDVVVLTRARNCAPIAALGSDATVICSTVAIDDYRYEANTVTTNVFDWYVIVASLRCLGQLYSWIRLLLLFLGCFNARSAEPHLANAQFSTRLFAAIRTLFMVPSQVVVYGNLFPILCYVLAHAIDSAFVYDLVSQAFNTSFGVFQLNLKQFLEISAVSMRSVWALALVLHGVVYCATHSGNWSLKNGVPGTPELSISFVSCLTILAQLRRLGFRNTRVESITEISPSARITAIRASAYNRSIALGNPIDLKCLLAGTLVLGALIFCAWCGLLLLKVRGFVKRVEVLLWPRTLVSYAAGTLWPATALVVSWNSCFVVDGAHLFPRPEVRLGPVHVAPLPPPLTASSIVERRPTIQSSERQLVPASSAAVMPSSRRHSTQVHMSLAFLLHDHKSSRALQRCIAVPDERTREIESMIYLMNLAAMSDPIVLLQLYWLGGGKAIDVFESRISQRLFLLPQAARTCQSSSDEIAWDDYTLLQSVSTRELPWSDLAHCG